MKVQQGKNIERERGRGGRGGGETSLFILYSICIVLQLSGQRERERGEGDRRPGREYRVTKDLLHPRPQTRFSSRNNTSIQSGKKWSEIGRTSERASELAGGRARIDDRGARNIARREREKKR